MATTYTPIATTTLGSAQSSVTFSSISGAYTDLVLIMNFLTTVGSGVNSLIQFNGDTNTNYSDTSLGGDGAAASSSRVTSQTSIRGGYSTSTTTPVTSVISINNYSNATTYKSPLIRWNNANNYVFARVGLWKATPQAITSINIATDTSTFAAGSTFTLYGIKAA